MTSEAVTTNGDVIHSRKRVTLGVESKPSQGATPVTLKATPSLTIGLLPAKVRINPAHSSTSVDFTGYSIHFSTQLWTTIARC